MTECKTGNHETPEANIDWKLFEVRLNDTVLILTKRQQQQKKIKNNKRKPK